MLTTPLELPAGQPCEVPYPMTLYMRNRQSDGKYTSEVTLITL